MYLHAINRKQVTRYVYKAINLAPNDATFINSKRVDVLTEQCRAMTDTAIRGEQTISTTMLLISFSCTSDVA